MLETQKIVDHQAPITPGILNLIDPNAPLIVSLPPDTGAIVALSADQTSLVYVYNDPNIGLDVFTSMPDGEKGRDSITRTQIEGGIFRTDTVTVPGGKIPRRVIIFEKVQ